MIFKKLARLICIAVISIILMSIVPLEACVSISDISGYWAEEVIA